MNFILSFLIGGLVCVIGQILIDKTNLTPARIMVGYVCFGVILGGFGIYQTFLSVAYSGATVPLIGFGNLLAKSTREAIDKSGFLGVFTGGLTSAAGGICAAIVFGYLSALLFKAKSK